MRGGASTVSVTIVIRFRSIDSNNSLGGRDDTTGAQWA